MEVVAREVQRRHLVVADFDAFRIRSGIECALDFQSGLCRRRPDQLDDRHVISQGPATPVLRDAAK